MMQVVMMLGADYRHELLLVDPSRPWTTTGLLQQFMNFTPQLTVQQATILVTSPDLVLDSQYFVLGQLLGLSHDSGYRRPPRILVALALP